MLDALKSWQELASMAHGPPPNPERTCATADRKSSGQQEFRLKYEATAPFSAAFSLLEPARGGHAGLDNRHSTTPQSPEFGLPPLFSLLFFCTLNMIQGYLAFGTIAGPLCKIKHWQGENGDKKVGWDRVWLSYVLRAKKRQYKHICKKLVRCSRWGKKKQ